MSKWPQHSFGTVIELAYGKSLPKNKRTDGGNIPVYGSNGITGWHDESLLDGPAVIIGRKGSAGAVQFVDGPCYPIDTTYFVRPRDGFDFDIKFLFYMLRHLDLSRLKTATGVPGLTREDAYREMIPVPPLSEQCRIVDLLSRAEGIVRLRREAEKKAAELIPALFFDMFGDPATNPKGWDTKELQAILTETKLGLVRGAKETSDDKPYQYLRMDAVGGGAVRAKGLKRVDAIEPEVTEYALRTGDFLFNTRNSKELVGKTGIFVGPEDPPILFNNNLMRMRFDEATVLPEFVNAQFQTNYIKDQLEGIKRGTTTVFAIYYKDLKGIRLRVPKLDLQRAFVSHMQNIRSIWSQQSAAAVKAQATFNALLAQAFSDRG